MKGCLREQMPSSFPFKVQTFLKLAPHASGVESLRQTCLYSTSPSYTYTGIARFRKESVTTPSNNCVYYAFETLEDKTKDYDFNDLVLRVNTPIDNGDNTYTSTVQIMCVGNTTV